MNLSNNHVYGIPPAISSLPVSAFSHSFSAVDQHISAFYQNGFIMFSINCIVFGIDVHRFFDLFHYFTIGFKQFPDQFQPFSLGFNQLSNLFLHFSLGFQQLVNIFQYCFSSVFQICFIIVAIDFRQFFLPFSSAQFQQGFSIQKCTSGAGSDRLPFLDDIL